MPATIRPYISKLLGTETNGCIEPTFTSCQMRLRMWPLRENEPPDALPSSSLGYPVPGCHLALQQRRLVA